MRDASGSGPRRGARGRVGFGRGLSLEVLEGRELMTASAVTLGDFDGDHKSDLAIYDQTVSAFYIRNSGPNSPPAANNGNPIYMGDPSHVNISAVADYNGDGVADLAIYDQNAAAFYVRLSGVGNLNGGKPIYMGDPHHLNVPVVGDFDGDGKADFAIYDETVGAFYVRLSSTNFNTALNGGNPIYMGDPNHIDIPVSGDFDGDGKTDLAIYDETAAAFYARYSSTYFSTAMNNGQPVFMGDPSHVNVPVAGDFDGDGKTDLAIYDSTAAAFYQRNSSTNNNTALNGGQPIFMGSPYQTNFAVAGDFDGDGKTDLAIFDENTVSYYARYSGSYFSTAMNGGKPVSMGDKTHAIIPVNALNFNPGRLNFL